MHRAPLPLPFLLASLLGCGEATPPLSPPTLVATSLDDARDRVSPTAPITLTFSTPLIRTTNTISWSGLATTSQPSSSNVLVSNGATSVSVELRVLKAPARRSTTR